MPSQVDTNGLVNDDYALTVGAAMMRVILSVALYFQLDRELEKVNTFYMYKRTQIDRRLRIVSEKCHQYFGGGGGGTLQTPPLEITGLEETTRQNMEHELMGALEETRAQMRRIMWFAEMNAKGFRKILKKQRETSIASASDAGSSVYRSGGSPPVLFRSRNQDKHRKAERMDLCSGSDQKRA
ncbi:hypothetical protein BX666DRAFT_1874361 [Dichotomocladium elegans]|nr:hypothetical protein BX666DRAFT_1874361 [Dichotomocladium elegans]